LSDGVHPKPPRPTPPALNPPFNYAGILMMHAPNNCAAPITRSDVHSIMQVQTYLGGGSLRLRPTPWPPPPVPGVAVHRQRHKVRAGHWPNVGQTPPASGYRRGFFPTTRGSAQVFPPESRAPPPPGEGRGKGFCPVAGRESASTGREGQEGLRTVGACPHRCTRPGPHYPARRPPDPRPSHIGHTGRFVCVPRVRRSRIISHSCVVRMRVFFSLLPRACFWPAIS